MFGLFFSSFIYERSKNVPLFNASQEALNPALGAVNTLFLLTSSWFVVLAVDAAKKGMPTVVRNCLFAALALGGAFSAAKIYEYSAKIAHGITLVTNDFFMFYFVFTGIHFVHLLIGMAVLGFLASRVNRGMSDAAFLHYMESGASYWHMVDLLWIILFPLLYLVR